MSDKDMWLWDRYGVRKALILLYLYHMAVWLCDQKRVEGVHVDQSVLLVNALMGEFVVGG